MINRTLRGVINGKTIELTEDPGMSAGQQVDVAVTLQPTQKPGWGDGLRRSAGALLEEWTDDDDRILSEIYHQRKQDRRRDLPE